MGESIREFFKMVSALSGEQDTPGYTEWEQARYREYLLNNSPTRRELERQRGERQKGPAFTLLMALEKGKSKAAERTFHSLTEQTYRRWEILAEPAEECGFQISGWDRRIRILPPRNGRRPFETAPEQAEGQYFLLISPGDTLPPEALFCFADYMEKHPSALAAYADEDEYGREGKREFPQFKPDFGKETMLSYNMIGRPLLVHRELWKACGGLYGLSAAEEYGFALRVCLAASGIGHIAKPLYTRAERAAEPLCKEAVSILERVLAEEGQSGYAVSGLWRGSFRVRGTLKENLKASVIIAENTDFRSLRRLLESIDGRTVYDDYELILLEHGGGDERLCRYYAELRKNGAARVARYAGKNSVSAMRNYAAELARGDALVFLDPSLSVLTPDWLEALLETLARPGIGAVSPKLLTPEGRIASVGNVAGLYGWYGSPYAEAEERAGNVMQNRFANTLRNVSVLPAKCIAVSTERFFSMGGFDESFLRNGYEAEFCLRLRNRSLRCAVTPYAVLTAYRQTVPCNFLPADQVRVYDVIRNVLVEGDPCYNPNYDCRFAVPAAASHPMPPLTLNPKAQF